MFEKCYPIKNTTSGWGASREIEIKNPIFTVVHPFCPYFALATNESKRDSRNRDPRDSKGAISIWLPK